LEAEVAAEEDEEEEEEEEEEMPWRFVQPRHLNVPSAREEDARRNSSGIIASASDAWGRVDVIKAFLDDGEALLV
jgi:hypothetical protein